MFWPSADERVVADAGAKSRNTLHVGVFGITPTMPNLTAEVGETNMSNMVGAATEVTSFFAQKAFKMAENISQTGMACRRLVATPFLQEIALWKHHESVG